MADITISRLNPAANVNITDVLPISDGNQTLKATVSQIRGTTGAITGSIIMWAITTPPEGYLECNGQAVNRTTYSALFNILQTTYGAGDGSTTFNLPDMRGQFPRGWDNNRGIDSGRVIGSSQLDQFQGHWHSTNDGFTGTSGAPYNKPFAGTGGDTANPTFYARTVVQDGINGTPRIGTETRPRNVALMFCIKT